ANQEQEKPVLNDDDLVNIGFESVALSALVQVLPDLTGYRFEVQRGIGATRVTLIIGPTPQKEMWSAVARKLLDQGYLVHMKNNIARISQGLLTKRMDPDGLVPHCDPGVQ